MVSISSMNPIVPLLSLSNTLNIIVITIFPRRGQPWSPIPGGTQPCSWNKANQLQPGDGGGDNCGGDHCGGDNRGGDGGGDNRGGDNHGGDNRGGDDCGGDSGGDNRGGGGDDYDGDDFDGNGGISDGEDVANYSF